MRLTVGPLPPAVYWRRRALVLAGVLVVLFLVSQACMAAASPEGNVGTGSSGTPSPPLGQSPAAPGSAGGPSSGTGDQAGESGDQTGSPPADPGTCTDQEMLIIAEAERTELPSGSPVGFTIRIRNVSDRACGRDVGADLQELYLVQGTGTVKIWSSDHCGAARGSDLVDFPPDHEQSYSITWNGLSSGQCAGQPEAPAGPAPVPGPYQLFGRLGTAYSQPVPIQLT